MPGTREEDEKKEKEEDNYGVPLDLDIQSHRASLEIVSNRTSLLITHEDGTMEDCEGEVTCLGLTPDVDRKSKIIIEEVSQENQTSPQLEEVAAALFDPQVRSVLHITATLSKD